MIPQHIQDDINAALKGIIEPLLDSAASAYMTSGPPSWESYEGHVRSAFKIGYTLAAKKYAQNGEDIA